MNAFPLTKRTKMNIVNMSVHGTKQKPYSRLILKVIFCWDGLVICKRSPGKMQIDNQVRRNYARMTIFRNED